MLKRGERKDGRVGKALLNYEPLWILIIYTLLLSPFSLCHRAQVVVLCTANWIPPRMHQTPRGKSSLRDVLPRTQSTLTCAACVHLITPQICRCCPSGSRKRREARRGQADPGLHGSVGVSTRAGSCALMPHQPRCSPTSFPRSEHQALPTTSVKSRGRSACRLTHLLSRFRQGTTHATRAHSSATSSCLA